ncbi:MAG: hypothetical protein VR65_00210 [Desulfobulbaceae bacterium BRH_c16a]|nr:MAG: hypothetical protein VR65_00210 [Desulfobulbaceae bacterium BRH_c16a]
MFTEYFRLSSLAKKSDIVLHLKRAASALMPFLVLSLILLTISLSFGLAGGINEKSAAFNHELPFMLIAFASLLYLMKPGPWRATVAAVPIIVLYLGMDLYYIFMHSIFKLDDLLLLPEGLTVSPVWVRLGVWGGMFAWAAALVVLLKRRPRELVLPLLLLFCTAAVPITAFISPTQFLKTADSQGLKVIPWSDSWTSARVGRATSLLLFAATKHKAMAELAMLPLVEDPNQNPTFLRSTLHDARNIHILVLESFLDPERFKSLKFRTPTAPPRFEALRRKMHVATSPVFGGGTAQAEFEILCGVPALKLYTSAEFNMLDGTRTRCLPSLLGDVGYRTIATQSYKPDFFNSEKAYRSLGFEETNYPTVFAGTRPTYLQYEDSEHYIYDGDLLAQNLLYVEKLIAEDRPFLNYVLGVYGHLPHKTDTNRFPPMVDIVGVDKNSQTYLAIQQFYYRAGAVADYLQKLREMDPDSLILITSDHLPPLDGGPRLYRNLGYSLTAGGEYKQNIWFYDGPEHKNPAWPDYHYEFMDFILDILTEGRICRQVVCKNRETWNPQKLTAGYNNLMSLGSGIVRQPATFIAGTPAGMKTTTLATPPRL